MRRYSSNLLLDTCLKKHGHLPLPAPKEHQGSFTPVFMTLKSHIASLSLMESDWYEGVKLERELNEGYFAPWRALDCITASRIALPSHFESRYGINRLINMFNKPMKYKTSSTLSDSPFWLHHLFFAPLVEWPLTFTSGTEFAGDSHCRNCDMCLHWRDRSVLQCHKNSPDPPSSDNTHRNNLIIYCKTIVPGCSCLACVCRS